MNGPAAQYGDIYFDGSGSFVASAQIGNCILAKGGSTATMYKNGSNVSVTSVGYNLCDDTCAGLIHSNGDQLNTDPLLDPAGLQDNGGPTQTIAPTSNSPAIDKGRSFGLTSDQRGQSRPVNFAAYPDAPGGDGSDIGAYETHDMLQSDATLLVNSLSDHDDGVCGMTDCTLREAIRRNNAASSVVNSITFSPSVTGTVTLTGGALQAERGNIVGPGARLLAISGNSSDRIFYCNGSLTISGLTIRDGIAAGSAGNPGIGGAIYFSGSSFSAGDCMFTNNRAIGGNGRGSSFPGAKGQGGAIYSAGTLTLNGCTFSNGNMATGGNGAAGLGKAPGGNGGAGQGGAVFTEANHPATITNCTFYNNTARGGNGANGNTGGNGGAGQGGAVGNAGGLTMIACTVSSNNGGNSSGGTGSSGNGSPGVASGGITNISGGTARVTGTISANNVANGGGGADVDGAFTSGGYNLLGTGDHSTGFTATGDMKGTDASPLNAGVLGPPSNTGGPTDTFTLTSTSPAINASNDTIAPHRDQRGYLRTGRSDIGAYEYNGSLIKLISVSHSGLDLVIQADVVKGKIYSLQRKANITDSQWQNLPPSKTATGNDTETFTDFSVFPSLGRAFYEVSFVQ